MSMSKSLSNIYLDFAHIPLSFFIDDIRCSVHLGVHLEVHRQCKSFPRALLGWNYLSHLLLCGADCNSVGCLGNSLQDQYFVPHPFQGYIMLDFSVLT